MKTTRILLADDQSLFREALRTLLALEADFEVVAEAAHGAQAVELAQAHRPDVILMDLRMPGMGGVEATRRIKAAWPEARVVVLTTFDEDGEIVAAMRAGAAGYLLKACSAERLRGAVRAAAQGACVLEPAVMAKVMAELARPAAEAVGEGTLLEALSERERAVLRCLARGMSNKEIGSELRITEGTVKNHMTNVLGKLGVLDRTQAALRARALGLE